jgi:hypothetical protein
MQAKLFLTLDAIEETEVICFSKRDQGEHKGNRLGGTPQEDRYVAFVVLVDVVPDCTERLNDNSFLMEFFIGESISAKRKCG